MKILIAIPCMDSVPVGFCQSLAQLKKIGECSLAMNAGSLVYHSRDALAIKAVQNDYDYVLWLDSDMTFPADLLIRMMDTLQKNDLDFLTGLYFRRQLPYSPVLFEKFELNGDLASWKNIQELPEGGLFEVEGCGFGCVLMKTDVILDVQGKFRKMFEPKNNCGEDLAFCWRARQCGYKVICDPTIECGHVGHVTISRDFYEAYKQH